MEATVQASMLSRLRTADKVFLEAIKTVKGASVWNAASANAQAKAQMAYCLAVSPLLL